MSAIFKRGNADVQANLTPMIDVTFLLIVFFVLVSQIVEVEHVDMQLPRPEEAASFRPGDEQRAVINVIPGQNGDIAGYRIGAREFPPNQEGVDRLTSRLVELYEANPNIRFNLRADRATHYRWIDPVIQGVSNAGRRAGRGEISPRLHLVVIRED